MTGRRTALAAGLRIYRFYGVQTGQISSVRPAPAYDAYATKTTGVARILVGDGCTTGPIAVNLQHLTLQPPDSSFQSVAAAQHSPAQPGQYRTTTPRVTDDGTDRRPRRNRRGRRRFAARLAALGAGLKHLTVLKPPIVGRGRHVAGFLFAVDSGCRT